MPSLRTYPLGSHPENPFVILTLFPSGMPFFNGTVPEGSELWFRFVNVDGIVNGIGTGNLNGDVKMSCHTGVWPSISPVGPRGQDDITFLPGTTYLSVEDSGGSREFSLYAFS